MAGAALDSRNVLRPETFRMRAAEVRQLARKQFRAVRWQSGDKLCVHPPTLDEARGRSDPTPTRPMILTLCSPSSGDLAHAAWFFPDHRQKIFRTLPQAAWFFRITDKKYFVLYRSQAKNISYSTSDDLGRRIF